MKTIHASISKVLIICLFVALITASVNAAPAAPCLVTNLVVSDASTTLDGGANAVATWVHPAWTANIPGATWIWSSYLVADPTNGETQTFTRNVTLNGVPQSASLDIAADNTYALWVNGALVANVTDADNYETSTQDTYDVASYLHPGANTLTFQVTNLPWNTADPQVNPAGLLYQLNVTIDTCAAYCGDGIKNGNEQCDGASLGDASCISLGFTGGSLGCTDTCQFDMSGCTNETAPVCGDGIVNGNEECDGTAGVPDGYVCTANCTLQRAEDPGCVDAIATGSLFAVLDDGSATVYNNDTTSHWVSLASYEMYSGNVADQTLFDSDAFVLVPANGTVTLNVTTPACAYQDDVICGDPLPSNPEYAGRLINSTFQDLGQWCDPGPRDENVSVDVTIAPYYPQNSSYVFICTANGFNATSYYWTFGDGQFLPNTTLNNVYHTYAWNGDFPVACTATNGTVWQTGTLNVSVEYWPELSCEDALAQGLLTSTLVNGSAVIQNNGHESYMVSLAAYEMYSGNVADQTLFDTTTDVVGAQQSGSLSVQLPLCASQVDLVCGLPLTANPQYGNSVINSTFQDLGQWCTPNPRDENVSVDVTIAPYYPQNSSYVFLCTPHGFVPTAYWWYFGDGQFLPNTTLTDAYHTYAWNGDFPVACTATNGTVWQTGTLNVSVDYWPELSCEDALAQGLLTGTVVDGHAVIQNNAHEAYTVSLASYQLYASLLADQTLFDSATTQIGGQASGSLSVELPNCTDQVDLVCGDPLTRNPSYPGLLINSSSGNQEAGYCIPQPTEGPYTVNLSVKEDFPQGLNYVFVCNASGFNATNYYWYFGDGQILPNVTNGDVYHPYAAPGNYTVACTATDGTIYASSNLVVEAACGPDGCPNVTNGNGIVSVMLVNPPATVTQNDPFTFTANVTCTGGDCGDVALTLDPQPKMIRMLIYNPNVASPDGVDCKGDYGAFPYQYLADNNVNYTFWCNNNVVDASVLANYDVLYVGRARASYEGATYINTTDLRAWVQNGGGAILESAGDSFEPGTTTDIWPGIYDLFGYNNCPTRSTGDEAGGGPLTKFVDHPIWNGVTGPVGTSANGLYEGQLNDSCIGTGTKIGTSGSGKQEPMVNTFGNGRTYSGVLVDYTANNDSERYFLNVIEWVAQNSQGTPETEKGVIPETSDWTSQPFSTATLNPMDKTANSCLENMTNGSTCTVTWSVMPKGAPNTIWQFYVIANATIANGTDSSQTPVEIVAPVETPAAPTCGDGVKNQESEQCDGVDFGSATCASYGFDSGSLSCTPNCTISTTGCSNGGGGSGDGNEAQSASLTPSLLSGSYRGPDRNCWPGYHLVGDSCVQDQSPATNGAGTGGNNSVGASTGALPAATNARGAAANSTPPSQDNLVTGAVTGGGVGAWSWLAVLLGLIAVVTVGYLYVRSQK